jgi:hypothetical protein
LHVHGGNQAKPDKESEGGPALQAYLAEYRELETEKRQMAQALLGLTGLVGAGLALAVANVTKDEPLPLAVLGPAIFSYIWVAATLRSYISEYAIHLISVEREVCALAGPRRPLTWETEWLRRWLPELPGSGVRRQRPRLIDWMVLVGWLIGGTATWLGFLAVQKSPAIAAISDPTTIASGYAVLGAAVGLLAGHAWLSYGRHLRRSIKAIAKASEGLSTARIADAAPVSTATAGD